MEWLIIFDTYAWLLVPILIFFARILDVSLGTIRVIFISRGYKVISSVIAFVEVSIWLIAIRHILENLSNVGAFIGYAAGFAFGTYVGIFLEEKICLGKVSIRIIDCNHSAKLIRELKRTKHTVTVINGFSNNKPAKIIYIVTDRKYIKQIVNVIKEYGPECSYLVEDIRSGSDNTHNLREHRQKQTKRNMLKGK